MGNERGKLLFVVDWIKIKLRKRREANFLKLLGSNSGLWLTAGLSINYQGLANKSAKFSKPRQKSWYRESNAAKRTFSPWNFIVIIIVIIITGEDTIVTPLSRFDRKVFALVSILFDYSYLSIFITPHSSAFQFRLFFADSGSQFCNVKSFSKTFLCDRGVQWFSTLLRSRRFFSREKGHSFRA